MKTAVITHNQEECELFVVDGDWTRFNGIYVNNADSELADELGQLLYPEPSYELFQEPCSLEEFAAAIRDGAPVIMCGMWL